MAVAQLTFTIRFAWWARTYFNACMLFAWLTGMEPDSEKIAATVARGMRLEFEAARYPKL